MKPFLLGEARSEEATGVVAGGFAVAGSAGEGADEALFGEKTKSVARNTDRRGTSSR